MWNTALPVLPCESVAEHVIVVRPTGNIDPDAGLHVTVWIGPSRASFAVGATNPAIEPSGPFASTARSAGTLTNTGGVWSTRTTVTWNVAEPVLWCASVA